MHQNLKILIAEDNKSDADLMRYELKKHKFRFVDLLVDRSQAFILGINDFKPDLILSDFSMPQFNGLEALKIRNSIAPDIPFILVTGSVNEEVAVECMRTGADDYILKENLTRLNKAILNALDKKRLQSEKNLADIALKNAMERLNSIFKVAPAGIGLVKNRIFIDVNPYLLNLTGYRREELIGKNCRMIYVSDEEYEYVGTEKYRQISVYGIGEVETRWKCKNGEILNVILSSAYLDPEDPEKGTTFTVLDITERKITEEKLRESESKLHRAQSIANVGNWELDVQTNSIWASKEAMLIYGIEGRCQEFPREVIHRIALPEYHDFLNDSLEKLVRYSKVFEAEYRIKRLSDGSIRWVHAKAELVKGDSAGVRISGVIQDVTERRIAEENLNFERKLLRTLIDNLPDVIYFKNANGEKIIANKADLQNMGYNSESEVIGKTDMDLFPGDIGMRGFNDDMHVIESGNPILEKEEEFHDKHGNRKLLLTSKIPLKDENNIITGVVGIGHDITERKRRELELQAAKEKAVESDKLKTAFLHNISHEIRTPMNAIMGFATLLSDTETDAETKKTYIDVITQSSSHLLSIISDIVDIANIEANLVKINLEVCDIDGIVNSVITQNRQKATSKNLQLTIKNILSGSQKFVSDKTKVMQILSNLISNAIKFTSSGEVNVCISRKDALIEFAVKDTGIGIPQEQIDRIFDRFYQVQNAVSRTYEGTGLGLSISKAYVELLGGTINVNSVPGQGSLFTFTIADQDNSSMKKQDEPEVRKDGLKANKKVKILVAEDVENNFRLINYFLSSANVEVIRASNGIEAISKFISEKNIDLILMDVKMPEMDGYTASRKIRELDVKVPIIAQTAYADDKTKAIEAGCTGFIAKPFDKARLLKIISDNL